MTHYRPLGVGPPALPTGCGLCVGAGQRVDAAVDNPASQVAGALKPSIRSDEAP
jgi:hypothetical protein